MSDAEINSNTNIQDTCNGNVLEPSKLLTDSDSSSESVNSDSEAYVYQDGFFKAQPSCILNPNQKIIKHYMKMPHANWRILIQHFEFLNSKYEKETEGDIRFFKIHLQPYEKETEGDIRFFKIHLQPYEKETEGDIRFFMMNLQP